MDLLLFLNEIVMAFLESIIMLLGFFTFTNKKFDFHGSNGVKTLIFPFFYTAFSFWATAFFPVGIHTLVILVFIIASASYITSSNILRAVLVAAMITILFSLTELPTQIIMNLYTKTSYNSILNDQWNKFIYSCIARIFQFSVFIPFYNWKALKSKFGSITEKDGTAVQFLILQISFIGILVFSFNYAVGVKEHIIMYNLLTGFLFLIFLAVSYFQLNELISLANIKSKFEVQEKHLVNMESLISIIRKEKHDFANHLNTIHAICTRNNSDATERVKQYIDNLGIELKSSYHFYYTGNDYVDGLLAVKSNESFSKNIHFEVEFADLLTTLKIKDHILVSIISNIVDNAIECFNDEQENKVISIMGSVENGKYLLSISDNGPMIAPEVMRKIFDKGFTTKTSSDKHDHGFGLYITKQLVHSAKGNIEANSTEYETEFVVTFDI